MSDFETWCLETGYNPHTIEAWDAYREHLKPACLGWERIMSEWQPIETAPRDDGLRILGWDGHSVQSLTYQPPYRYPEHIENAECWYQESDSGRATSFYPTHWMPLPEPPDDEWCKGQESLRNVYSRTDPLETMTDEQRMDVFKKYCLSCGSKDPSCVCWNDE